MENSYVKALELFENRQYSDCFEMCKVLVDSYCNPTAKKTEKETEEMKKVYPLYLRAMVYRLDLLNEEQQKIFMDFVGLAKFYASNTEEMYSIMNQVCNEINQLALVHQKVMLGKILENPSFDLLRELGEISLPFLKIQATVQVHINRRPVVEKEGLTLEEADKKYLNSNYNETEEEYRHYQHETALCLFEKSQGFVSEANASAEFVKKLAGKSIRYLSIAYLLTGWAAEYSENEEKKFLYLTTKAEILTFLLEAKIYPNGLEHSLIVDGDQRNEYLNNLTETYSEIKKIDETFVQPSLPDITAKKSYATDSSGGCYVATAIYGSYDCPQVWTLRRYRDNILSQKLLGRMFIHTYYKISPTLVKFFGSKIWFNNLFKPILDKMVINLNDKGITDTPYEDKNVL